MQAGLAHLGLANIELFGRTVDNTHLDAMARSLQQLAASGAAFVLTGCAAFIQRLLRLLKAAGVPANRLLSKAHWAAGKAGLD